jgi:pimeloyl-ACP methyl ester carboxylesterase
VEDVRPRSTDTADLGVRISAEPPLSFRSWPEAAEVARPAWASLPDETIRHRLRHRLREHADGSITWRNDVRGIFPWRERFDALLTDEQWELLARLACPTLLLRGGRSAVLSREWAERMAATNPRIELVELAEAGHFIHREQPEAYAAVVERFLTATEGQDDAELVEAASGGRRG